MVHTTQYAYVWWWLVVLIFHIQSSSRAQLSPPPRIPVLFRNHSSVNNWKLSKSNDDFQTWYNYFPFQLRNVYSSHESLFPYYDSYLAKNFPRFSKPYGMVDATISQICPIKPKSDALKLYRYYSGDIMQNEFKSILQRLNTKTLFKDINQLTGLSGNIWIGGKDVKATIHYDGVENIFVQLYGKKEFTLWPPQIADKVLLHGRNHPYACQSRFNDITSPQPKMKPPGFTIHNFDVNTSQCNDVDDASASERLLALRQTAIRITVHPGDVLYIPPYWFHEATALSCSISVSFWWDPVETAVYDKLITFPLPIEASWEGSQIYTMIIEYLTSLLLLTASQLDEIFHARNISTADSTLNHTMRLLRQRYREDFAYLKRDTCRPLDQEILQNATATKKIHDYSTQFVHHLITQILFTNDSVQLDAVLYPNKNNPPIVLQRINEEEVEIMQMDGTTSDSAPLREDFLLNQCSILLIKLLDYIEEVLLYTSTMTDTVSLYKEQVMAMVQGLNCLDEHIRERTSSI